MVRGVWPGWPDRLIAEIAGHQLGLITREQLIALGVSPSAIDRALARGRLRLVHRGVYAVGHDALAPLAAELAAVLALGAGAVLSHASAAALWGLARLGTAPVHVTLVDRDAGRGRAGIRVHRVTRLDPRDLTVHERIPVTTPARALLDIAPLLNDHALAVVFDRALKERVVTRDVVAATVRRAPRHTGAGRLGRLAEAELRVPVVTRSETERRMLRIIGDAELPRPEVNAIVESHEVDLVWREPRLVVEIDGYEFHSTRRSFESDHDRDLRLEAAGFQVMRFTAAQIRDRPGFVLARLAERLGALGALELSRAGRASS